MRVLGQEVVTADDVAIAVSEDGRHAVVFFSSKDAPIAAMPIEASEFHILLDMIHEAAARLGLNRTRIIH